MPSAAPPDMFDLLPSTALGAEETNLQCLTHSQLQPSEALNLGSDHFLSLSKDLKIYVAHTHTRTVKLRFRLESPSVAGHLLRSLGLSAGPSLSERPPSTTTGLKEQEIGWTLDNGPVDRLIMQLLSFLIESLHQLHFWLSCRSQFTIQTRGGKVKLESCTVVHPNVCCGAVFLEYYCTLTFKVVIPPFLNPLNNKAGT